MRDIATRLRAFLGSVRASIRPVLRLAVIAADLNSTVPLAVLAYGVDQMTRPGMFYAVLGGGWFIDYLLATYRKK